MTEETNQVSQAKDASDPLMVAMKRAFDKMHTPPVNPADYAPKSLRARSDEMTANKPPETIGTKQRVEAAVPAYPPPLPSAGMRHGGKLPVNLIPSEFSLLLAAVLEYGAQKYAPHNFEKGMDPDDLLRGAESHLLAMKAGDLYDTESGLPHAGHAAWNMLTFAMQMMREPAMEEVFVRVLTKRRAGNLPDVCREYASKHGLDGTLAEPELNPTPWHERVDLMRSLIKPPPGK